VPRHLWLLPWAEEHHPDEVVEPYLEGHVNPYHVGGDFGVTSGMRRGRDSRMVHPGVEAGTRHIAAVSAVGDICHLRMRNQKEIIVVEVVGFRENKILLMPLGELRGVEPGCQIIPRGSPARVRVGPGLLGRVLDGLGHPIDQGGPIAYEGERPLYGQSINPILNFGN
jgi:flagellum-specific ATP synthase